MRLFGLAALALCLTGAVWVVWGTQPFGQALLSAGLPRLAVPLMPSGPGRAAALFHAGRHGEAADAFAAIGARYNEGLAAALGGDYARALAAWEAVLQADPGDAEARANHRLVSSLFAGTELQPVAEAELREREGETVEAPPGQGGARAAGDGDEVNNAKTGFWMPEVSSSGVRRLPRMFDAQFMAATPTWLDTLEDQPGRYLQARLAAEQKTRETEGTALPSAIDPQ